MVIKKFVGKNEEEATAAARKELGEGIVIMNVRMVKPKGLFSFIKEKQTEVTAAIEDEHDNAGRQQAVKDPGREAIQQVARVVEQKGLFQSKKDEQSRQSEQSSIEQKLDSLQTLLESQLKRSDLDERKDDRTQKSGQTSDQAKSDSTSSPEQKGNEDGQRENKEQDKFIRLLYNTMIENEVDEKYANQILEDIDKVRNSNTPFDYILANIYQKIILKFGKSEGIIPADKGPRVVFFIGPTGVGKTTTIAKIASSFVVEGKKKTALMTADTYRIAATEQLRTYAQILEVPFRIIYNPEEMAQAVEDFQDFEYILVDTSGHSHRNEEQLSRTKEYLDAAAGKAQIQTFLVMSANTKYRDMLKIADNYKGISDYQLIFTKLDETVTLGSLLNVKLHMDTPIAYITYGQNVPNDIERFNPQKTVKQLLGGKS